MNVTRTIQYKIKKHNQYWKQFDELSWLSKNLYNLANYIVRQEFIKTSKEKEQGLREHANWIRFNDLCKICQKTEAYKAIGSNVGQATLRLLDRNWKSFMQSIKDWSRYPEKYTGRPKMPQYLDKENGRYIVGLDNNKVKNKDGYVYFAWKPLRNLNGHFKSLKEERIYSTRIVPRLPNYILEVIYEVEAPEQPENSERIAGIDLGINNLITIATNCGVDPIVINGRPLKAMNAYYNKKKAVMHSELALRTKKRTSKKINRLNRKRNAKVDDYIHKASRRIIDYCVENNIDTVVCGHNIGWKQKNNIGKVNNQNFMNIPHSVLIQKLQYKCEDVGIKFIEVNEAYTSGTSFLDGEEPTKENYNNARRKTRGLFVSNKGIEINADVNGAYQIIRKQFPNAFTDEIKNMGLHPIIINL